MFTRQNFHMARQTSTSGFVGRGIICYTCYACRSNQMHHFLFFLRPKSTSILSETRTTLNQNLCRARVSVGPTSTAGLVAHILFGKRLERRQDFGVRAYCCPSYSSRIVPSKESTAAYQSEKPFPPVSICVNSATAKERQHRCDRR